MKSKVFFHLEIIAEFSVWPAHKVAMLLSALASPFIPVSCVHCFFSIINNIFYFIIKERTLHNGTK